MTHFNSNSLDLVLGDISYPNFASKCHVRNVELTHRMRMNAYTHDTFWSGHVCLGIDRVTTFSELAVYSYFI